MKRLLLPAVLAAAGLALGCSSGQAGTDGGGQASPSAAADDGDAVQAPPAEDASAFASKVPAIAFKPIAALPKAPASAASRSECPGIVRAPQSAGARAVAAGGWGVTGEGRLGHFQLVSFAGKFEQGTSGSCYVSAGNIAVFDGTRIRAIAYVPAGNEASIGQIAPFGKDGLRIWDGDVVPVPLADLRADKGGVVIDRLAAEERTCGGVVPGINGLPITKARERLIGAGWKPVNHGSADDRIDPREQDLAAKGVVEVESCSGTGFGYCGYDYKRAGAALSVTTVGDGEDPGVSDYAVKCGG